MRLVSHKPQVVFVYYNSQTSVTTAVSRLVSGVGHSFDALLLTLFSRTGSEKWLVSSFSGT